MDYELISREEFNNSFKNMLRDFYVYQFKENTTDFKTNTTVKMQKARGKVINGSIDGKKIKISYDIPLPATTFSNYKERLRTILCKEAHVEWGSNKKVEYIKSDASSVMYNPFYKLYRNCIETTRKNPGTRFSVIMALLLLLSPHTEIKCSVKDDEIKAACEKIESELKTIICDIDAFRRHMRNDLEFKNVLPETIDRELGRYLSEAMRKAIENPSDGDEEDMEGSGFYYDSHNGAVVTCYRLVYKLFCNGLTVRFDKNGKLICEKQKPCYDINYLYALLNRFSINETPDKSKQTKYSVYSMDSFELLLDEMEEMGFLQRENGEYRLSQVTERSLLACGEGDFDCRFKEFLLFASNTLPLGAIGASLCDRFSVREGIICHKHNYLIHALNDYNMIDLLNVISVNKGKEPSDMLWVRMECRDANVIHLKHEEIICVPLAVRESTRNGRQYLIYYHVNGSIASIRLDFIDKIHIGKAGEFLEQFIKNFSENRAKVDALLDYTYGVEFDGIGVGNVSRFNHPHRVEVLLDINDDKAEVIIERVRKEKPRHAEYQVCTDEKYGRCISLTIETASTAEVLEWIKSFTCRIIYIRTDGIESPCGVASARLLDLYNGNDTFKEGYLFDEAFTSTDITGKAIGENGREGASAHRYLFNDYLSKELFALIKLTLSAISEGWDTDDDLHKKFINSFVRFNDYSVASSRRTQAENFVKAFFGNDIRFNCNEALDSSAVLPLTKAERLWLSQALDSDFAGCFFDGGEIERLKAVLNSSEKLFDIADVECYDQYVGYKELCRESGYREIFRALLTVLHNKSGIDMVYGKKDSNIRCIPARLEYSKRDNIFRLVAVDADNSKNVLNYRLDRIKSVKENKEITTDGFSAEVKPPRQKAVILFDDRADVPDSILNEFSFCEKKCEKSENKTYKLTLYYDGSELYDIAIRLLAYGDNIYVAEGDILIKEMKDRLERQIELERKRYE